MKKLALAAVFLLPCLPAQGILFWNLDNSANQSDPGTGAPFEAVGRVTNSSNTAGSGTVVYLGSGFVLTANHVTFDPTFQYVTFNGTDSYQVDTSWKDTSRSAGYQVATNVDLAVVKLLSAPSIAPVTMLTTPSELIAPATVVGWGRGRDPSVPLGNASVAWGNATTEAKRWGLNEPKTTATVSYGSGNFTALVTILGGNGTLFDPDGLGDSEAAVTLNDSGAGLFQNISGTWYLIGIATNVEAFGTSVFGNDRASPAPRGQANYYARISEYDHLISALIPEPSAASLALAAAAAAGLLLRKRRSG
ncbi:MAG: hypothetical protein N2322_00350 [Terrimicrobiaceae bacterium]|nr:hypothetical protein [Terrimicrobiaceae bacterium]